MLKPVVYLALLAQLQAQGLSLPDQERGVCLISARVLSTAASDPGAQAAAPEVLHIRDTARRLEASYQERLNRPDGRDFERWASYYWSQKYNFRTTPMRELWSEVRRCTPEDD